MLVVMLCAMLMSQCRNVLSLHQAQKTSTFRLSLLDQARDLWMDNQYKRKCNTGTVEPVRTVQIQEYQVELEDGGPCVTARWQSRQATIYMDEQGIVEVEWVQ